MPAPSSGAAPSAKPANDLQSAFATLAAVLGETDAQYDSPLQCAALDFQLGRLR